VAKIQGPEVAQKCLKTLKTAQNNQKQAFLGHFWALYLGHNKSVFRDLFNSILT